MACTVTESFRTVSLEEVVAGEIDPSGSSYPFPPLSLSGLRTERTISVLVLENEFIRAEIAPSLGGRILSLTAASGGQSNLITPLEVGGLRGVRSPFGIQLTLGGEERLDALGLVDVSTRTSEDGSSAEILIGSVSTWPFSFHLTFGIVAETSEVAIEAKIFNRSLSPALYNAGILVPNSQPHGSHGLIGEDVFIESPDLIASVGKNQLERFSSPRPMSPRQLDTWTATISWRSDPIELAAAGSGIFVGFAEERIRFSASRPVGRAKAVVLTPSNQSLEAALNLDPTHPIEISVPADCLPLQGLVVLAEDRTELLRWPIPLPEKLKETDIEVESIQTPSLSDSETSLKEASFSMGNRYLCHLLLGIKSVIARNFERADFELEQSLLFNGEDHLAWWLKGFSVRAIDTDADNQNEILNAHFLAPLEPALRVDAFLGQPLQSGSEGNPILAPLADNPDAFLDIGGQLIDAGLLQEAVRLLGEAIRFRDLPMLRYFLAYAYLTGSRLEIEAAEQIRAAGILPFTGPFPIRPSDHLILDALEKAWPDDLQLSRYRELVSARNAALLEKSV